MAEIIDIRRRRRVAAPTVGTDSLRVRISGPDLHWLGVVGGILAGALLAEGGAVSLADSGGSTPAAPLLDLTRGEGGAPALLVAGGVLPPAALRGCNCRTVLLAGGDGAGFPGLVLRLPLRDPAPTPLCLAVACAGGAARLLALGWSAVEQALRRELVLAEPIADVLIPAFEAYHRLTPWAGTIIVPTCR